MSHVVSVSKCDTHQFSKKTTGSISLIKGKGIEGDAHRGKTVKHRSRVKADPDQPNLRQVHLIHYELIQELQNKGFDIKPSTLGENITTLNIDLLSLPTDTILKIGSKAIIKITDLRNPCAQLDNFQKGLTTAVLERDKNGNLIRKAGVMGIIIKSGIVKKGDDVEVSLPPEPYKPLEPV